MFSVRAHGHRYGALKPVGASRVVSLDLHKDKGRIGSTYHTNRQQSDQSGRGRRQSNRFQMARERARHLSQLHLSSSYHV